jgi:DNA-binding CsgD family transcriptional regulator
MTAIQFAEILLAPDAPNARCVIEASVHLPHRGKIWRASFRDETGRQRWRSTGTTDRSAALALAKQWEEEARRKRGPGLRPPEKALIRAVGGGSKADTALFTQREVALIMKISERAVRNIERRAVAKLRRNPVLKALWREWSRGEIEEQLVATSHWKLTPPEIAAVYALAHTSMEREVIRKLMALIGSSTDAESR